MNYNKLWSLINKQELSKSAAGRIVDMSPQGFISMMENKSIKVSTLEIFCNYFNVPISCFYEEDDTQLTINEPKASETGCLKCIEKDKRIEDLTREVKKGEYTIDMQGKLIAEYETQLGKNAKVS